MLKELLLWLLIGLLISGLSQIVLQLYLKEDDLVIAKHFGLLSGLILFIMLLLLLLYGFDIFLILDILFVATLIIIWFVDEKMLIIPDLLNLFLLILVALKMLFKHQLDYYNIIASIVFILLLVLLNLFYRKKKGIEAIGYGDLKLLFGYALYMSLTNACISLFIASLTAIFVEIVVRKRRRQMFPFGPYLAIGMIIALFLKFI